MYFYLDTTERDSFVVALIAVRKVVKKRVVKSARGHSEKFLAAIAALLKSTGKSARDIAGIAVVKGPGSFTSLRIGVSCANALAYGLAVPVVGVGKDEPLPNVADLFNRNHRPRRNPKPPLAPSWKGGDLSIVMPEYGREPDITTKKKI